MIVYRPHRGTLADSMAMAREFDNEDNMKEHIVKEWQGSVKLEDIVIGNNIGVDERINWTDNYYVCVKAVGEEDYMKKYGCPQCIGMCAYGYRE